MENNNNESSNQQSDWKQRELGALWKKSGKTQNYFSGRINLSKFKDEDLINIVGFSNKLKKENPNAPDVIIYYSPSSEKSGRSLRMIFRLCQETQRSGRENACENQQ